MKKKISFHIKNKKNLAGLLLFTAGILIFMGTITAESYYPLEIPYTTRENEISDLGATKPPNSIIKQPSATIFNTTMIFTGIIILCATLLLHLESQNFLLNVPLGFLGLGVFGVGVFPGNITPWHSIFAFILFTAGGMGAILSYKFTRFPINLVFLVLGVIALFFLFFNELFIPYLGKGGTERFVAYPIMFWMIGLGSYLTKSTFKKKQTT
ncbi:MAG: DUF998 domain-containing protein [Candidatus Thermoplasmatota archaeon]|nr:DUF998 domain-containing protein [Candidatus Thermoplasmatota archaeon]MBS3801558.1 DUF998 domain-containing protein [Candidatus Thermoplasmatota archaeon]